MRGCWSNVGGARFFFFTSGSRHTRLEGDWSSDVCSSDLFGQNQVQYRQFDWRVRETDHFLVYYYPEERASVTDAARMAERAYARLSRLLGHRFVEKIGRASCRERV